MATFRKLRHGYGSLINWDCNPGTQSSTSNIIDVIVKHSYTLTIGGKHIKINLNLCIRTNDEQNMIWTILCTNFQSTRLCIFKIKCGGEVGKKMKQEFR